MTARQSPHGEAPTMRGAEGAVGRRPAGGQDLNSSVGEGMRPWPRSLGRASEGSLHL